VAEETEKPLLKVNNLDEDTIQEAKDCFEMRKYAVRCFFYGALCVPEADQEYGISLRIADKEWLQEKPATHKKRYNRFNSIVTEDLKDKEKDAHL